MIMFHGMIKMKLSILCEISHIDVVREKAKVLFNHKVLKIPLSPSGEMPATHFYCELTVSKSGYKRMMSLKKCTIMEPIPKLVFLMNHGLKEIKQID